MQTTVFYENWQMDCCGEPFAVGDVVKWDCVKNDFDEIIDIECDYYYEAHGDENSRLFQITGQVLDITHIEFQYENQDGMFVPIGYHKKPIEKAGEFMFERGGGFLVVVENIVN